SLGLTGKEFSFFEIVRKNISCHEDGVVKEDKAEYITEDDIELSKNIAKDVADIVEKNYTVDWAANPTKTADIARSIFMMLNLKYFKQINLEKRKQLVQPLLQLAKRHYSKIEG
ncbi:MAG TPA: type I restriction endonuclease subunit R, partial [Clostridiaceae bacterium]|nr:type I restriction endonuclease subunit R [Clostridiaceae bacterium]